MRVVLCRYPVEGLDQAVLEGPMHPLKEPLKELLRYPLKEPLKEPFKEPFKEPSKEPLKWSPERGLPY